MAIAGPTDGCAGCFGPASTHTPPANNDERGPGVFSKVPWPSSVHGQAARCASCADVPVDAEFGGLAVLDLPRPHRPDRNRRRSQRHEQRQAWAFDLASVGKVQHRAALLNALLSYCRSAALSTV